MRFLPERLQGHCKRKKTCIQNVSVRLDQGQLTFGACVISFFRLSDVVSCITHHNDDSTKSSMILGCVTACIEPSTSIFQHKLLFPTALDHCANEYVSCIAFTGKKHDVKVSSSAYCISFYLIAFFDLNCHVQDRTYINIVQMLSIAKQNEILLFCRTNACLICNRLQEWRTRTLLSFLQREAICHVLVISN